MGLVVQSDLTQVGPLLQITTLHLKEPIAVMLGWLLAAQIATSDQTDPVSAQRAAYSTATKTPFVGSFSQVDQPVLPMAISTSVAQPLATACASNPSTYFTDVRNTDYFYNPVEYLANSTYPDPSNPNNKLNIMSGYTCGGTNPQTGSPEPCDANNAPYFRPYSPATRGQFCKIIVGAERQSPNNLAGWINNSNGGPGNRYFADVDSASPFYEYIQTSYNKGIISGYNCGGTNPQTGQSEPCDAYNRPYFRPYNNITRGQATKLITLGQGWSINNWGAPQYSDAGSVFGNYINTLTNHFIIQGYDDGTFRPDSTVTRAQISKIIYRAVSSVTRQFGHGSSYSGSNNYHNSTNTPASPLGNFSGMISDWGSFRRYEAVASEMSFDQNATNYLVGQSSSGLYMHLVFHAFDKNNSANCTAGSYTSWYTNLPGWDPTNGQDEYDQNGCNLKSNPLSHNELRLAMPSPNNIQVDAAKYWGWAIFQTDNRTFGYNGEINIDNYLAQLDSPGKTAHDNMTKFCYNQGDQCVFGSVNACP